MVDLLQQRLVNQHLSLPSLQEAAQVVAALGAVQSQDYPAAKWALGLRLPDATDASIERAFDAGSILRTHVLRPTWHFVVPADIRWLLALTAPRVKSAMGYRDRVLGVTEPLVERSNLAIATALAGGRQLTRYELGDVLRESVIEPNDPQAITHLIIRAELDGVICSGARRGKQFTYALLDERVPPAAALDRDAALAELARRYFTSHGPATVRDMAWWSGLTVTDVKRGIEINGAGLCSRTLEGLTYWSAPSSVEHRARCRAAYLLPNFDEYTVAYRDRDLFYQPSRVHQAGSRIDVPFGNVILWQGRVAGTWKRTAAGAGVRIHAHWYAETPSSGSHALAEALARFTAFYESPVELVENS